MAAGDAKLRALERAAQLAGPNSLEWQEWRSALARTGQPPVESVRHELRRAARLCGYAQGQFQNYAIGLPRQCRDPDWYPAGSFSANALPRSRLYEAAARSASYHLLNAYRLWRLDQTVLSALTSDFDPYAPVPGDDANGWARRFLTAAAYIRDSQEHS